MSLILELIRQFSAIAYIFTENTNKNYQIVRKTKDFDNKL